MSSTSSDLPEKPLEPKSPKSETYGTTCGVSVMTWGSHYDAGNGMLHFLDSHLFGGNVGHAAIKITFPADEEGKRLIEYCKKNGIDHKEKTVHTKILNKENKTDQLSFEEKVYEIYWSWWPSQSGRYFLSNLEADMAGERDAVSFDWDPKAMEEIQPEARYHKGKLAGREVVYGPDQIIHSRDLDPKNPNYKAMLAGMQLNSAYNKIDAINLLQERIHERIYKPIDEIKNDKEISFDDEGTIKTILNRFIPSWKSEVKNPKNLSETDINLLGTKLKKIKDDNILIRDLYIAQGLRFLQDYSNESINLEDNNNSTFKMLLSCLDQTLPNEEKWQDIIRKKKNLEQNSDITKLDAEDLKELKRVAKEKLQELRKNPVIKKTLDIDDFKDLPGIFEILGDTLKKAVTDNWTNEERAEFEKNSSKLGVQQVSEQFDKLQNHKLKFQSEFKEVFVETQKTFQLLAADQDIASISGELPAKIKKLESQLESDETWTNPEKWFAFYNNFELLKEECEKNHKDLLEKIHPFYAESIFYGVGAEVLSNYKTQGLPPDNVVKLPIQNTENSINNNDKNVKGLNIERMLKKMVELKDAKEGFQLYTKNCSKTTSAILEAGAEEDYQKEFFRNMALGYFGNPQEVFNSTLRYQKYIAENKKPSWFSQFSPIKKAQGYLIGIMMNPRSKRWQKGLAVVGEIFVGIGFLASFTIQKIFTPLQSFKDLIGLVKYTWSTPSKLFKTPALIILVPLSIVFSPLALLQAIFIEGPKYLYNKWKKPEKTESKVNLDEKLKEKSPMYDKLKKVEQNIANVILKKCQVEIDERDALNALTKAKNKIQENKEEIPVFSKSTMLSINQLINAKGLTGKKKEEQEKAIELFKEVREAVMGRIKVVNEEQIKPEGDKQNRDHASPLVHQYDTENHQKPKEHVPNEHVQKKSNSEKAVSSLTDQKNGVDGKNDMKMS